MDDRVAQLMARGVEVLNPATVTLGREVDLNRIAPGVVIHPGCRILGAGTWLAEGAELGREAPVTIENCRLAKNVKLAGGYFRESVLLEDASFGSGAQVREHCLIEEQAGGAHAVGLKQTILMPFVTLGSLINFCDCLMSGGTSRKDHSEVGSSYIHFNFTPNQDKATPSLIGDVAKGVMLRERPIFLGGQGGLVGPSRIAYGSVIAAGIIMRENLTEENRLIGAVAAGEPRDQQFVPGIYWKVKAKFINNVNYIANLIALTRWYESVRALFLDQALVDGALKLLNAAIDERLKRLDEFVAKLPVSLELYQLHLRHIASESLVKQKQELLAAWPRLREELEGLRAYRGDERLLEVFLERLPQRLDYLSAIRSLDTESREIGSWWLMVIVNHVNQQIRKQLPSFV
ncbi:MAG: Bifunctional protein GlmU [Deltaproteobacteria bacterium ADurb.Bin510]|nr:MAG: Bifunctional protein GlmU [Deltaproteobacteria bacterium ADurb.Bin510]